MQGVGEVRLRTLAWSAEGDSRGLAVVVHGYGEHAGRYGELADHLNRAGFDVFAYDHRGHGGSQGRRGTLRDFAHLLADLDLALDVAEAEHAAPGPPFLIGHSMGGLVVLRWIQTRRRPLSGVVLSAPWLATKVTLPERIASRLLERIAPDLVLTRDLDPGKLTRDEEKQRALAEDPLKHRSISAGLYAEMRDAQREALAGSPDPDLPLLVLLPGDDPITDVDAARSYAERLPGPVEIDDIPGARHEPFQDLGREELFARVAGWLDARAPG